ncbi:MAG: phage Gp37/Gp68 family protein [Rhizorhabdus sp.]
MSDNTKISWSDATANVINGCSLESPGCTNCYAMGQAHRFPVRQGLTVKTKGGMVWTGDVRFHEPALIQVLRWSRPRAVFWNAHGDTFHPSVPDAWIDRCFAAMALTPQHFHQVLTKRSGRMREYMATAMGRIADAVMALRRELGITSPVAPLPHVQPGAPWWPLANVWLGVSVEDQKRAEERIPDLLATPAAVRWLSCEPLLGPVDLCNVNTMRFRGAEVVDALHGQKMGLFGEPAGILPKLDWIVVGGESGHKARPMNPQWARSLRDQCASASVPFHFKQNGEWVSVSEVEGFVGNPVHEFEDGRCVRKIGKKAAGRTLDGVTHDAMPLAMEKAA